MTLYPEISDLFLSSDALVTDYSSVFFDFALTDKPMVFLAPDLEAEVLAGPRDADEEALVGGVGQARDDAQPR